MLSSRLLNFQIEIFVQKITTSSKEDFRRIIKLMLNLGNLCKKFTGKKFLEKNPWK